MCLCACVCVCGRAEKEEQKRKRVGGGILYQAVCASLISRAEPRILILHIAMWSYKRSCSLASLHLPRPFLQSTIQHTHTHTHTLHTIHHPGICPFKDELHSLFCLCLPLPFSPTNTQTQFTH